MKKKKIKKPVWEPARVRCPGDDDVKCWTFAIPNLPLVPNKKVMDFVKYIASLDGYVCLRPEYPNGTLLIFRTENDAKGARNLIRNYPGYGGFVGEHIVEVYVPKEYV